MELWQGVQQLPPRLTLVSHAIAHQVTLLAAGMQRVAVEDRLVGIVVLLQTIALLMMTADAAIEVGSGVGCTWLRDYCEFVRRRAAEISCDSEGFGQNPSLKWCRGDV